MSRFNYTPGHMLTILQLPLFWYMSSDKHVKIYIHRSASEKTSKPFVGNGREKTWKPIDEKPPNSKKW